MNRSPDQPDSHICLRYSVKWICRDAVVYSTSHWIVNHQVWGSNPCHITVVLLQDINNSEGKGYLRQDNSSKLTAAEAKAGMIIYKGRYGLSQCENTTNCTGNINCYNSIFNPIRNDLLSSLKLVSPLITKWILIFLSHVTTCFSSILSRCCEVHDRCYSQLKKQGICKGDKSVYFTYYKSNMNNCDTPNAKIWCGKLSWMHAWDYEIEE